MNEFGEREAGINLFVLRGGIFEGYRTNSLRSEGGGRRRLEMGIIKKIGVLKFNHCATMEAEGESVRQAEPSRHEPQARHRT